MSIATVVTFGFGPGATGTSFIPTMGFTAGAPVAGGGGGGLDQEELDDLIVRRWPLLKPYRRVRVKALALPALTFGTVNVRAKHLPKTKPKKAKPARTVRTSREASLPIATIEQSRILVSFASVRVQPTEISLPSPVGVELRQYRRASGQTRRPVTSLSRAALALIDPDLPMLLGYR